MADDGNTRIPQIEARMRSSAIMAIAKSWLFDLLRSVGLYLAVVVGGSVCFLSLAPIFCYLPYRDRPGPGWFGKFPAIGWADFWHGVAFMSSWALLLMPLAAVAGLIVFSVTRILERFRTPRTVVAVVGGLLAGLVSGYIVLGVGWYIAIAPAPVYVAAALGLIYGSVLLPRSRAVNAGGNQAPT